MTPLRHNRIPSAIAFLSGVALVALSAFINGRHAFIQHPADATDEIVNLTLSVATAFTVELSACVCFFLPVSSLFVNARTPRQWPFYGP